MIALAAVFVVLAAPASTQTWPSRPIKLIVPHAPGGVTDLVARLDMIASRPNDKVDPLPQIGMA